MHRCNTQCCKHIPRQQGRGAGLRAADGIVRGSGLCEKRSTAGDPSNACMAAHCSEWQPAALPHRSPRRTFNRLLRCGQHVGVLVPQHQLQHREECKDCTMSGCTTPELGC